MKRILSWILSVAVLLTLVITVHAITDSSAGITVSNAEVTLYEADKTVTIVLNTPTCYNIEGVWSTTASGKNNSISLTDIKTKFEITADDELNVSTGEVIWIDYTFGAPVEGDIMTATYTIPANTPAGEYTVTFTRDVFTGADYTPDNEDVVYTATIKVTRHTCSDVANDGNHTCDDPNCRKTGVTTCSHGSYGKNAVDHWSICAECGETISDTTVAHDFTNGDCVCGAKPLGDVNRDGKVNVDDLTVLARHVSGIQAITDEAKLANADVNEDGKIDAQDLTLLARCVTKMISNWNE